MNFVSGYFRYSIMQPTLPQDILVDIGQYVERFLRERVDSSYVYHDIEHTREVVSVAERLAHHYQLGDTDLSIVSVAAWFHDTGYASGWEGHEARSADMAEEYLRSRGVEDPAMFAGIRGAIMATKMPQQPTNLIEEIIADADLSHLGEDTYWDRCGRIRQEFALTRAMIMSDRQWIDFELRFMLDHAYHTEAARELFDELKTRHVKQLHRRRDELRGVSKVAKTDTKDKDGRQGKPMKTGRGVETMYRATYSSHVNLSNMADSKANIMLSVNAIILSMSAANLFPKLDTNPHLMVPTIILMGVCLTSLFFAIQATRPQVTEGKSSLESIKSRRSNLLFFGNFYNMTLEDYEYGMREMIEDDEFLYATMSRDIYFLGIVLAKKYAFLRMCYTVFLYGFIVAVLAFVVAAVYYNYQSPPIVPSSSSLGL